MKKLLLIIIIFSISLPVLAQKKNISGSKPLTPFVGFMAGGCVYNPFSFIAGVQKKLKPNITLSYDLHYWNTGYESYCDSMYSKGKFRSITPSVKIAYNTGKKEGMGLMAGVGLGYMFAKDRGTEQPYTYDVANNSNILNDKDISNGNWDFNSISPSFSLGVGFRVLKMPVAFQSTYYFAKTTEGWMATAGGVGFKIGLRKVSGGCCAGKKKCK
jgi:hypothetical protein